MAESSTATASDAVNRTSLYVGDLHPDVTEGELQRLFGTIGPLYSVRLCRDRVTLSSLCYAYVNFLLPHHASKALSSLNHTKLRGKTMRIMWCQRDPLVRKTAVANLYVKNLVPSVTSARLEETFGKYGTILSCKVSEENGVSKGFGFVQFDSEYSATTALNALNGTMLEGKQLYVCKFVRKNERKDSSNETFTNLFFKNLAEDVTEDFLKEKFSDHGTVCNLVIMRDNKGKSKGFGFVNFCSHEEAKRAVERLNGAFVGSKNLFVARAQKKAEREEILKHAYKTGRREISEKSKGSNLFVKNLSVSLDDKKLKMIFSPFGKITSAKVMHNEIGLSKGFGFVCFSCPEEAKRALDALNGSVVHGKTIYVALAQSRDERQKQQQSCPAQYLKQPFRPSHWDFFVPQYYPLYYNVPPLLSPTLFSMPHLSSFQPRPYQSFSRCFSGNFPFQDQCHLGKAPSNTATCKQPQQEPSTEMVYQWHPPKSAFSRGWKQYKEPSNIESSTIVSGSVNASTRSSAHWVHKKKLPQLNAQNVQTGDSGKTTEVVVEMDARQLLNSQNPLVAAVEKGIQTISGSQACTYSPLALAAG